MSLCEEQCLLYIQSEEVKERKRQRKVDTEVADLRLKLATTQSKNIVLSNREIRLLRLVGFTIRRCGGSLVVYETAGPGFECGISHNDSDALQDLFVKM